MNLLQFGLGVFVGIVSFHSQLPLNEGQSIVMHCLNIKLVGYVLYLDAYKVNIMNIVVPR